MFEIESTVFVDNNEYVVVDKYTDGDNTYVYLSDLNNVGKVIYRKLVDNNPVEITDPDEFEKVIQQVNENIFKRLKEED